VSYTRNREDLMAEPKTKATAASVDAFLNAIKAPGVREDCRAIARIMEKATGATGVM
jgi:hypothetical protein